MNYIISTEYRVLDKMINFIENKSICEILIKLLNELIEHQSKTLVPGISDVPLLQQSGQSSESQKKQADAQPLLKDKIHRKVQDFVVSILENQLDEDTDMLKKLGAIEVLQSLLQKKMCYQALTTKKSFEIMTRRLVSDDEETKKFMYILMRNLVDFYEKHERLEKRINIDNFEDSELLNSNSGSFMDKKSKNSKK